MFRTTKTVTVTALAAAAEEIYTLTDSRVHVGDVIAVSPLATPEVGWGIVCAWVDAEGSIKVKASNFGAGALTGGSLDLRVAVLR